MDEVGKTGSRRIATCLMNYPHGRALVSAAKVWLSQVEPPTLSKREDREERERERARERERENKKDKVKQRRARPSA